jgi:3-oxoacyl-[acyl-carrier protein] reductase
MKKKIIIFGGSKGIGYEILKDLINLDFELTVVSRKKNKITNLKNKINFFKCDVLSEKSFINLIKKFKNNDFKADIVIHCIGGNIKLFNKEFSQDNFYQNWKLNFGHTIDINNFFIKQMTKKKWGRILHLSAAGIKSYEAPIAYTSAKASLNNYIKHYGKILASKNIIVSAISPGPIELEGRYLYKQMLKRSKFWKNYSTRHISTKKLVKPSEILPLVKLLISDNSLSYSGVNWDVDGGYK